MTTKTPRQALVTGANRGLGLELTRQLLQANDRVVAACRQPGQATELNHLAGEYPGRLHVLPLDFAREANIDEMARELPMVCDHIDLLINNAGVLFSGERFGSLGGDHLQESFQTNAAGPLLLTQALSGQLADGARIANISSQLGSITNTGAFRTPSYAISKAAQNMATALLASALAERGITVVALHPGWVQTDMGGNDAEIDVTSSAKGLLSVIAGLTPSDNGRFLDWQGRNLPW